MSRLYIICFDVCDERRLRAVSKTLEDVGTRVQYSVFECYLEDKDLTVLQSKLAQIVDIQSDHIRYYPICPKDQRGILLDGNTSISTNDDYHLL